MYEKKINEVTFGSMRSNSAKQNERWMFAPSLKLESIPRRRWKCSSLVFLEFSSQEIRRTRSELSRDGRRFARRLMQIFFFFFEIQIQKLLRSKRCEFDFFNSSLKNSFKKSCNFAIVNSYFALHFGWQILTIHYEFI